AILFAHPTTTDIYTLSLHDALPILIDAYQSVTEIAFAGEVNGKVTDDEGEPIPSQIQIEKENIDLSVDKDGAFSFKLREGTHEVTIESFGYETKTTDITVTKDEVTEVTWELGKSEQYTISGKVRDSNGDPVPFAYVRLLGTPLDTMRTDMDGNFTFSKVPTGTYEIILSGKEFAAKREEVKVDQDLELNISMGESSRVADSYWQTANSHVSRNALSGEDISLAQFEQNWTEAVRGHSIFSSPVVNK